MTGWRNAGWGLLVLAGLVLLAAGPGLLTLAVEADDPPVAGRVDIGYGASIDAPPGARLDRDDSRPGLGDVVLLTDGVAVSLSARAVNGDPAAYRAHARTRLDREGRPPIGAPETIDRGERGALAGGGCYAALTDAGVGVVVLVTPVADCAAVPATVWRAVTGIRVEPL
jgi:hypothetical protein